MKKCIWVGILAGLAAMAGCKKDPHDTNEQEQITVVRLRLTNQSNSADVREATWDNTNGEMPPVITELTLKDSAVYDCEILLLSAAAPIPQVDTISAEVEEEGDEHQFFFSSTCGASVATAYADQDKNGDPIGLKTVITTGAATTCSYRVVLKHQPDGAKTGDMAAGETDIDVSFEVTIVQ